MPAAAATVQALLLTQKAEVKQVKLSVKGGAEVTLQVIQAAMKKKEAPELAGTYTYKGLTLYLFGFTTGKAGTENKHELPPPHDTTVFFGDVLLLASKSAASYASPTPFKPEDYEAFYTKMFGGFDEADDEEEEEEEVEAEEPADDGPEEGKEFDDLGDEEADDAEEGGDEEDEEADDADEGEGEAGEDEGPKLPVAKKRAAVASPPAAKRKRAGGSKPAGNLFTAGGAGAMNVYGATAHIPPELQLQEESDAAPLVPPTAAPRMKALQSLETMFSKTLSRDQIITLERVVYNGTIAEADRRHCAKSWSIPLFTHLYVMRARHIAANFNPESYVANKELFAKFQRGELAIEHMRSMDAYQLFETRWKECFEQQQIREKSQLEGNKAMATDQFLCTRCWKRECTYYEMQTRSADEPMTIFITCLNCGKHWRQ